MDRALVVVGDTDLHRELLREAGELAAGVGAELVLLTTLSHEEFDEGLETMESIAEMEGTSYDERVVLEAAENFAKESAREQLDDIDVRYDAIGAVVDEGEHANEIIEIAEDRDCDHIFITGRRRSPTGKAIFGDTAQSVILNFDGRVTIATA